MITVVQYRCSQAMPSVYIAHLQHPVKHFLELLSCSNGIVGHAKKVHVDCIGILFYCMRTAYASSTCMYLHIVCTMCCSVAS